MAHYAFLDENNIVTEVIVGMDESDLTEEISSWEDYYSSLKKQKCKRTSYNTHAGKHLLGGTPFRKNFAGIGYYYDDIRDAFIPPKIYESWLLDEETCTWIPPVPNPGNINEFTWNENTKEWVKVNVN